LCSFNHISRREGRHVAPRIACDRFVDPLRCLDHRGRDLTTDMLVADG
jgi:hypothetical protein